MTLHQCCGADSAEASEHIEATGLNTIGLTLEKVKRMTPQELAEHLAMSGTYRIPRSVLLAAASSKAAGEIQSALPAEAHAFRLAHDHISFLSRRKNPPSDQTH